MGLYGPNLRTIGILVFDAGYSNLILQIKVIIR